MIRPPVSHAAPRLSRSRVAGRLLVCVVVSPLVLPAWMVAAEAADAVPVAQTAADPGDQALATALAGIERDWSRITFENPGDKGAGGDDDEARAQAMGALADRAASVAASHPGRAEPLIWQALALSSQAGFQGGLGALSLARHARDLLEQAGRLDYRALRGAVPTSLGALYYKVPGFPLGFGDDDKARHYLEEGVAIDPDGMDSNYFYGDFLIQQDNYRQAVAVLTHALAAAPNPGRPVWDAGRRAQIRTLLDQARRKLAAVD